MALNLFSYRTGSTPLHKTPAILKLIVMFAVCALAFSGSGNDGLEFLNNVPGLVKLCIAMTVSLVLFVLGGTHWKAFRKMRFVLFLGAFVIILRSIYVTESGLSLSADGAVSGLLYTLRFFITAFCAETIYETTSSLEIKECLESIELFIAKVIPPVKKLKAAFVISMAINFIPLVFGTWEKVHLAAKARQNKKPGFTGTAHQLFCEFEALFSCLLFRAETRRKAVLNRS